jgi:hypothetical protein
LLTTLGITTLGTIVHIIMTLGIMVGLGVGVIPTIPGTRAITGGHITTVAGAGMEEAGMADIGDIHLVAMDIIEVDMLLQPILVAEVDGQALTMLADVHTTDLLPMAQQAMVAEAEISTAEQVA